MPLYLPVYTDKKTGQQKQSAVSVNRSASRPVMATRAPACVRTWAAARPMPLDPPVIRTTRSLNPCVYRNTLECCVLEWAQ